MQTQDSTWGSDHFPIFLHLNSKKLRSKHAYTTTNWNLFGSCFQISDQSDLIEFIHAVSDPRASAAESVVGTVEVENPDVHMHALLLTAQRLIKEYQESGKHHTDLMKLKRHYKKSVITKRHYKVKTGKIFAIDSDKREVFLTSGASFVAFAGKERSSFPS